jgi:hypothetical protein
MFYKGFRSGMSGSWCPWLRVTKQAYLGLTFTIKGQVHYGWARLGYISAHHRPKAKLTGYAYETIPNKPIITGKTRGTDEVDPRATTAVPSPAKHPKPATLGMLATGASGLSAWRRKESVLSAPAGH